MKFKFWEFGAELLVLIISIILLFLGTITFFILSFYYSYLWFCFTVFLIMFIICLSILLLNKKYFSKIKFSEQGIQITWFKTESKSLNWNEFLDAKRTPLGRGTSYLTLITQNDKIDIYISSQKMYNAIISTCSNNNIKYIIENLSFLKWYRREKKNKN